MISVVSGYDVVPRMCVRGLGHLILSIDDLIKNCKHTKQSVLCCRGCCGWELDIDVDVIEARQEDTLRELKLPKTESDDKDDDDDKDGNEVDGGGHSEHSSLTRAGHHSKNKPKIGMKILRLLAQMVATRGAEEERPPMMFTPGRIIHLELEEEDTVKKLVDRYTIFVAMGGGGSAGEDLLLLYSWSN